MNEILFWLDLSCGHRIGFHKVLHDRSCRRLCPLCFDKHVEVLREEWTTTILVPLPTLSRG